MTSILRPQKSFDGRYYKVLAQQLPIVLNSLLRSDWNNMTTQRKAVVIAILRCFVCQGELLSLVFMGESESNFNLYKLASDAKVKELTRAISDLDDALAGGATDKGSSRLGNKPKLHLLHHLPEDIARFATAIHFGTEKDKRSNKFIRKHILHTKRKLPSPDVLALFGQQFMFRQIVDGASWTTATGERVRAGATIQSYMAENPNFRDIYLGSDRQYADNNQTPNTMNKHLNGFFVDCLTGQYFLETTTNADNETVQIQKLQFVIDLTRAENELFTGFYYQHFPLSAYTKAKKDAIGNPMVQISSEDQVTRNISQVTLVDAADVQPSYDSSSNACTVVNISKFGNLWRCHDARASSP